MRPQHGVTHGAVSWLSRAALESVSRGERQSPITRTVRHRVAELDVEEEGSDLAAALWDGAVAVISGRLTYPEVRAPWPRRAGASGCVRLIRPEPT